MNLLVKVSLGLVFTIVLINAEPISLNKKFDEQCQLLRCNTSTEICKIYPKCDGSKDDLLPNCVYCALKPQLISSQQQLPIAPRLLAKSSEPKPTIQDNNTKSNSTIDDSLYDEYYEYDEDDILDKNDLSYTDDYANDYVEPYDPITNRTQTLRKSGICPKVLQSNIRCDTGKLIQPDCRFDTDCPGELKCCEAVCGKRICKSPIKSKVSVCPTSFQCTLNCRLGYRTDSNGCLKCECQSCPSMEQCTKNCPSGYLKDLFGCDVCECNDRCPPFSCNILCPSGVGFAQSQDGCPLCQCAIPRSKPIESTSLCQEDVHCPPGFRCLTDSRNVPMCQAVPTYDDNCDSDFPSKCPLKCLNYIQDERGCPTCACILTEGKQLKSCPEIKCRANCGVGGYQYDENDCQTCKCANKESVQCSRVMCRMFCQYGFKRDENDCEYCACNESPQACPILSCKSTCANGYRKDYSGCQTCECNEQPDKSGSKCSPVECTLQCKYGLQRDESDCKICACNQCPLRTCRMYCVYGFRRNEDGCEICECDWSPVSEKIQCSERIPCPDTRVCNPNLKLCEKVDPDKVNWFTYDFDVQTNVFDDAKFVQLFKSGLINNIAQKYDFKTGQITVSVVGKKGETSFQIMPYFSENMDEFQKKIDQIDVDLNSHEFRSVLPAVVRALEDHDDKDSTKTPFTNFCGKLRAFLRTSIRSLASILIFLLCAAAFVFLIIRFNICRRNFKNSNRSDSKSPIYEPAYHQAPTEDDQFHTVHTPGDLSDKKLSQEKQVFV